MFDQKIWDTIDYCTRRLVGTFKLQQADREDVKQELTLKALEVMYSFQEGQASLITYLKKCLANKAVDLARQFKNVMATINIETLLQAENDSGQPISHHEPLPITIEETWNYVPCYHNHYIDLKLDIEMILQTLSPRQNAICQMLMRGMTQREIAYDLGLSRSRIQQLIRELRPFFINV